MMHERFDFYNQDVTSLIFYDININFFNDSAISMNYKIILRCINQRFESSHNSSSLHFTIALSWLCLVLVHIFTFLVSDLPSDCKKRNI